MKYISSFFTVYIYLFFLTLPYFLLHPRTNLVPTVFSYEWKLISGGVEKWPRSCHHRVFSWDLSRGKISLATLGKILTNSILIAVISMVIVILEKKQDQLRKEEVEMKAKCMIFCCLLDCSCLFNLNHLFNCWFCSVIILIPVKYSLLLMHLPAQTCHRNVRAPSCADGNCEKPSSFIPRIRP